MKPTADQSEPPHLSVVVTIVGAGDVLRGFLRAITTQVDPPTMEVIVPFDDTIADTGAMAAEFPGVTFLAMGPVETFRPVSTAAGQHELYDRRRAAGLKITRGAIMSLTEDRAPPRPGWAATVARLHRELPHAAIGGAIECSSRPDDHLNWSFYLCDFSRYALPFESGARQWISDVNVTYKRAALDAVRAVWDERFNEARVHWALSERGDTLWLSNELVVDYQTPYRTLGEVMPVRFHWGRLFGFARARQLGVPGRAAYALISPLLPLFLFIRHGRNLAKKGKLAQFVRSAPATAALIIGWVAGESWGTITGKP